MAPLERLGGWRYAGWASDADEEWLIEALLGRAQEAVDAAQEILADPEVLAHVTILRAGTGLISRAPGAGRYRVGSQWFVVEPKPQRLENKTSHEICDECVADSAEPRGYVPRSAGYLRRMEDVMAEKIARNNSAFREANASIEETAKAHGLDRDEPVPFICECSDRACVQVIGLTLAEYERVRSDPRWFAHAPSHEERVDGSVAPVEKHSRYVIVEKINRAGEIAEELAAGPGEE